MQQIESNKRLKKSLTLALVFSFWLTAAVVGKSQTANAAGKVPVILIHGIGGSNLRQPTEKIGVKGFGRDGGFPNDVAVGLRGDPQKLQFDSRGEPRSDTKSKTVVAAGFYDVFGSRDITDLSKYLKKQNYVLDATLFEFAYDFRFSVNFNAAKLGELVNRVKQISGSRQVDIVGHSLGGLVAKAYLADEANQGNVRKLIFVGTPHLGAPKALKALRYGDDLGVFLIDKCKLKRAAHNFPGMYNLLPGKRYFERMKATDARAAIGYFYDDDDADKNGVRGLLDYEQMIFNLKEGREIECPLNPKVDVMKDDSEMKLDRLNANLIDRYVVEFHDALDDWKKPLGVAVFNIVGYGVDTIENIKQSAGKVSYGETLEGDGTVPLWSAESAASDATYYVNFAQLETEHSAMIGDDRIALQIYSLLERGAGVYIADTATARPTAKQFAELKNREIKKATNKINRKK